MFLGLRDSTSWAFGALGLLGMYFRDAATKLAIGATNLQPETLHILGSIRETP